MDQLHIVQRTVLRDLLPAEQAILESRMDDAVNLRYPNRDGPLLPSTLTHAKTIRKSLEPGQSLNVLEIGPGKGTGLKKLAKIPNIRIYTLGPRAAEEAPAQTVHVARTIEETVIPDFFHIIQSRWGGIHNSVNRTVALENALNSLAPGGRLILHPQELSGVPIELEHDRKSQPAELMGEIRECIKAYVEAESRVQRRMEQNDAFYAVQKILRTLSRQGFGVPSETQIAMAHAHDTDMTISRRSQKADLRRHYADRAINKIML